MRPAGQLPPHAWRKNKGTPTCLPAPGSGWTADWVSASSSAAARKLSAWPFAEGAPVAGGNGPGCGRWRGRFWQESWGLIDALLNGVARCHWTVQARAHDAGFQITLFIQEPTLMPPFVPPLQPCAQPFRTAARGACAPAHRAALSLKPRTSRVLRIAQGWVWLTSVSATVQDLVLQAAMRCPYRRGPGDVVLEPPDCRGAGDADAAFSSFSGTGGKRRRKHCTRAARDGVGRGAALQARWWWCWAGARRSPLLAVQARQRRASGGRVGRDLAPGPAMATAAPGERGLMKTAAAL